MINPVLTDDLIFQDSFSHSEVVLLNDKLSYMVLSPWRQSNIARNIIIIEDTDTNKKYVLTSKILFSGKSLLNNPYIPIYWENESIKDILVSQSGDVKSKKHGCLPYYWAPFIDRKCILDIDDSEKNDVLSNFIKTYSLFNNKAIHPSKICLKVFNESCFCKINNNEDYEFLKNLVTRIINKLPDEFISSWSHGDLWAKDIFIKEKGFTVIDWEWSTQHAPAGMDILDLMCYNHWPKWENLLGDVVKNGGDLELLQEIKYFGDTSIEYRKAFNTFFIYRCIARIVAQEGVCKVMKNTVYKNMINFIY